MSQREYTSRREIHALNAVVQVTFTDNELLALCELIRDRNQRIARLMNAEPASDGAIGVIVNAVEGRMTLEQKLRWRRAVADGTQMDESKWDSFGLNMKVAS